jgi:hypothetical protein
MRINSKSFGAENGLYTWLDAEIPSYKEFNYLNRAFPGIRIVNNCKFPGER